MNSSIYAKDSCSNLEALWNHIDTTELSYLATQFVNPTWSNLVGKTILLTLPTDLDLKKLTRFNKVISRYPLLSKDGSELSYVLSPYQLTESKPNVSSHYSRKILNKYLLTSEISDITDKDNFLLGSDPITNGYINTIGYLLIKNLINQDKEVL